MITLVTMLILLERIEKMKRYIILCFILLLIVSCSKSNQNYESGSSFNSSSQTTFVSGMTRFPKDQNPDTEMIQSTLKILKQKFQNQNIAYLAGEVVEYCLGRCPDNNWVKTTNMRFELSLPPKSSGSEIRKLPIDTNIGNASNELKYNPTASYCPYPQLHLPTFPKARETFY